LNKKLSLILFLILLNSCKNQVKSEVEVYNNDFETNNLTNITNGVISQFNGTGVLGTYNKGGFILRLGNLPKHNLITISFDLYIHDTWDGNKPPPDGPDIWQMLVDDSTYINATFSNDPCLAGNLCAPQSYPLNYPNNFNNPKAGAYRKDLPGFCSMKSNPIGTTQYKIVRTFTHTNSTLVLQCLDKLVQTNTTDQKCDESWSVDNINIKAITL